MRLLLPLVLALGLLSQAAFAGHPGANLQAKSLPSNSIYGVAKASVGKEMWKGFGLANGTLGCAAAVSNVLRQAGISSVRSPLVTAMRLQLLRQSNGCLERVIRDGEGEEIDDAVLLKDCQPGDILLAFRDPPSKLNAGTSAHCGIMGQGTQVYTNNWMDGIWTEVEIHQMFDAYPYVRLLRLGAGGQMINGVKTADSDRVKQAGKILNKRAGR